MEDSKVRAVQILFPKGTMGGKCLNACKREGRLCALRVFLARDRGQSPSPTGTSTAQGPSHCLSLLAGVGVGVGVAGSGRAMSLKEPEIPPGGFLHRPHPAF